MTLKALLESLEEIVYAALDTNERRVKLAVSPHEATQLIVAMTRAPGVLERIYGSKTRLRSTARALINALVIEDE